MGGGDWQLTCMAFGLSAAPWVFTKLLRPVTSWLRARGLRIFAYLDDFFVCGPSVEKVREFLSILRAILEWLGFVVNDEKSVETPTQQLVFGVHDRFQFDDPIRYRKKTSFYFENL